MADFYYTIKDIQREEIKIKKSKFIATAIPVKNQEHAKEEYDKIKKEFHDSRHNCWAWRFGENGLDFRYSDDGEPPGSAGKPILFSIKKYEISDVLLVVTRFFGGVKLGVGGLVRAYSEAAELVLQKCEKVQIDITKSVKIFTTYDDINTIKSLLDTYAVSYEDNYTDFIDIKSEIPLSKVEEFTNLIVSKTNARSGFRVLDK